MLMSKRCPSCKRVSEVEASVGACPKCSWQYIGPEVAERSQPTPAGTRIDAALEGDMPARRNVRPVVGVDQFAGKLRSESIYPTFRGFVQISYVIGLLLAAFSSIGGVIALFKTDGGGAAFGLGIALAILLVLMARLFKEMWLMLADMSDAIIRIARNQDSL